MKANYILILVLSVIFVSCGATKATQQQKDALKKIIDSRQFVIESDWALPMASTGLMAVQNSGLLAPGDSASRINLIGNPNELKLNQNQISSQLPYFGEVQFPTSYNGASQSINLKDSVENYKVSKSKNNSYIISFDAKSEHESFSVIITMFPNLKADMSLNGTKRFTIRYTGKVSMLDVE